jgi:hypothetical protein
MHYGKFLSKLRGDRGLTQAQLADEARVSRELITLAEKAECKRMFPRTFLSVFSTLCRHKQPTSEEFATYSQWSGISVEVLLAAYANAAPAAPRVSNVPDLPPLSPSLVNAMAACLLKMSQAQLADVLYEVAQTLTRAQLQHPLPPGSVKPTTITGPGLLGLQHPDDNGYQVTVYFEPREPVPVSAAAAPSEPPKLKLKGPSRRRSG